MAEQEQRYETTGEHFELFKEEALKWIRYFGLLDWDVIFIHADGSLGLGECSTSPTNSVAKLKFYRDWKSFEPTDHEIRKTAFHEVIELLFARFDSNAFYRHSTEDELNESRHMVIRTLENTVYRDLKDKVS